jgi:predicted transcriptional regulator
MAVKRKAPQKSKAGKPKTKTAKPAARKPVRKAAAKRATGKGAKKAAKKALKRAAKPAGLVIKTDPALEARLRMLGTKTGKSLEAIIAQALTEFADNWEDHMQTVAALRDTEDRVHLSVPKE